MAIEVFNRYEHKYLINEEVYQKVRAILDKNMTLDFHNANHRLYTISNIYYDTCDDYLIRNSISKPIYKEKLRLRSYGIPDKTSITYLEIKKKYRGITNKRRTAINLNDAYDFLKTKNLPVTKNYMNSQVLKEIEYFLKIYPVIPRLYLAYDRLAYFEQGSDLRISFDKNIRKRRYDLYLEHGDFGEPLIGEDIYVMEIKTAFAKPLWLAHMLSDLDIKRVSFSKYGTEYKNYTKTKLEGEKLWMLYLTMF